MPKILLTLVLSLVLLLPYPAAFAQRRAERTQTQTISLAAKRGADLITASQLRDYLYFIASDEMEGRDTPSRGLNLTAKFLAMKLSRLGLKPAGDNGSYFQKIVLRRDAIEVEKTSVQLNKQQLTLGEDYIPLARPVELTAPMVFAGNGWLIKSRAIDSYKGINANGKIAVIFSPIGGLPRGIQRTDLTGEPGRDWMDPSDYAHNQGAVGLVMVPDFWFMANWNANRQRLTERGTLVVDKFQPPKTDQLPSIVASPRLTTLLFQGERQNAPSLFEAAVSGEPLNPFELNPAKTLTMAIQAKTEPLDTQNVVAILEGSDPILKNEYVALGAHYDHVGIGAPLNGDRIYNGADDNGSGSTALLAIAEALATSTVRPKRSILFVWHTGEEKGLWGSRYFVENPTVPLDNIVAHINLDMIGRSKKEGDTNPRNRNLTGPHEIYVIGSRMMSTELGDLTAEVNKNYLSLTYNYRYDDPKDPERFFYRSDHYNYARKGIPIVFFFVGVHEDYHRPGDTADKIDYEKMEKVTRTVFMTMWELADRPNRPKVDKPLAL